MMRQYDQYPYEGFEDMWPRTKTTPTWFGVGHKHMLLEHHPQKHIVYYGQGVQAVIHVKPTGSGPVDAEILHQLGAVHDPAIAERYSIQPASYAHAGYRGETHLHPPMFVLPDTRLTRHGPLPGADTRPQGMFTLFGIRFGPRK